MRVDRQGFSLVEVLVASMVLGSLGIALLTFCRSGARGTARAGEAQIAAGIAGTVMDRLVAAGVRAYSAQLGLKGKLVLADLVPGAGAIPDRPEAMAVDGIRFSVNIELTTVEPGLVKLGVVIEWESSGPERSLEVERLLAADDVWLDAPARVLP